MFENVDPVIIYEDNEVTKGKAMTSIMDFKLRHLQVNIHFIKEHATNGEVKIESIRSSENIADIFTKSLPVITFLKLRGHLMGNDT